MGGGVGLQVIPAGRPELGVGVAVGVGVVAATGEVGVPVGEDEPAPHWASVSAATDPALASARCLRFIAPSWTLTT
jgi:hypothetical protein